jgi:hypothetical protein
MSSASTTLTIQVETQIVRRSPVSVGNGFSVRSSSRLQQYNDNGISLSKSK